ncbi:glucokinase [Salinibius halmophilus]|uniref:glucokinase n=1 Tax=Salinibius halmophilus TaxID=1853216 RepID=UPI00131427D2|nr:glucokinase [Salinibius halmophilus]
MKQVVVGDIGGTNVRLFALDTSLPIIPEVLSEVIAHQHPTDVVVGDDYMAACVQQLAGQPEFVVLAIAGAVNHGQVQMTNCSWSLSEQGLSERLGCDVRFVNDFAAQGSSLELLGDKELVTLQANPQAAGNRIVTGPGTGLGLCARPHNQLVTLETEAGHAQFAPVTEEEWQIGNILSARFGRVSWERILSGPGLLNLYQALARLHAQPGHCESPAQITASALDGDSLALRTMVLFSELLGSYAGDMALVHGATGGVYLSGGLVSHLRPWLEHDRLLQRFVNKGRFTSYLQQVPLHLVIAEQPGLLGVAQIAKTWS